MAYGEKTGGREKGVPNRVTKELRQAVKDLIDNEMETIEERLDSLGNKDRLELIIKLMAFVMPKYQEVNQKIETYQEPPTVIFTVNGIPKSWQNLPD